MQRDEHRPEQMVWQIQMSSVCAMIRDGCRILGHKTGREVMHHGASCVYGNELFKLSVKGSGDINQGTANRHAFGTLKGDAELKDIEPGNRLVGGIAV